MDVSRSFESGKRRNDTSGFMMTNFVTVFFAEFLLLTSRTFTFADLYMTHSVNKTFCLHQTPRTFYGYFSCR